MAPVKRNSIVSGRNYDILTSIIAKLLTSRAFSDSSLHISQTELVHPWWGFLIDRSSPYFAHDTRLLPAIWMNIISHHDSEWFIYIIMRLTGPASSAGNRRKWWQPPASDLIVPDMTSTVSLIIAPNRKLIIICSLILITRRTQMAGYSIGYLPILWLKQHRR